MKKSMKITIFLLLGATVVAPSVATDSEGPTLHGDLRSLNNRESVVSFLQNYAGPDSPEPKLGDFRLADLDGDGAPELLAVVDYSGRQFFNHLLIYKLGDEGIDEQDIEVWNMNSLTGVIKDLDGDGWPEILLRRALTPYLGVRPMATWTAVYSLFEGKMMHRSTDFLDFYEHRILPDLDRRLANARDSYSTEAMEIERDHVLHAVGRIPKAGLNRALRLARSEDPTLRAMAVGVLENLSDAEARQALEVLAQDSDAEVANLAQGSLNDRTP